ncbi:MAG: PhzF family phenazine biosynthesis isomerase [Alphaproteobacteria bacterium]|nr:PhzF family phenazine biosynthesis isomerase [Alphaproteobacteria bacterium]
MAKRLSIYQVDAFADRLFAGNPAAVVPLSEWLADATMQSIAAENNLAETAFFAPEGEDFRLRWFTPAIEVPLCGHATLASAYVLMTILDPSRMAVRFHTKSGPLQVTRAGDVFTLDFPSRGLEPVSPEEAAAVASAMGGTPVSVQLSVDRYMVLYENEAAVRALAPDIRSLAATRLGRAIATAPGNGDGFDFVSRFFAPAAGIDEDPVTGSAHCTLVPYWAGRLGKKKLVARQVSRRGGTLHCQHAGARTYMGGAAKLYLEGTIHV